MVVAMSRRSFLIQVRRLVRSVPAAIGASSTAPSASSGSLTITRDDFGAPAIVVRVESRPPTSPSIRVGVPPSDPGLTYTGSEPQPGSETHPGVAP